MHNHICHTPTIKCCQNCLISSDEEFKQVVNLKKSGLLIYVHNNSSSGKINFDCKKSIILHNTGYKELKRFDYVAELCQYKTKCFKCQALIQYIRCLIDNLSTINKNEILSVCQYCKRLPQKQKCKRCEYAMYKFLGKETERYLKSQIRFHDLMCTIRQVLLYVMKGEINCKHNLLDHLDFESEMQLDELLKNVKLAAIQRQPNIESLLDFLEKQKLKSNTDIHNEKILHELFTKINSDYGIGRNLEDNLSLYEASSRCICKYLVQNKNQKSPSFEKNPLHEDSLLQMNSDLNLKLPKSTHASRNLANDDKSTKLKKTSNKGLNNEVNLKIKKVANHKLDPDFDNDLILKMIKQRKIIKKVPKQNCQLKKDEECPQTLGLPMVETLKEKNEILSDNSESIIDCNHKYPIKISEMIKGTVIVPYEPLILTQCNYSLKPKLFHTQQDVSRISVLPNKKLFAYSDLLESNIRNSDRRESSREDNSGVILYQLSNREFIDKGWTQLPIKKIMRKINIYKMIPSHTKFDWFKNHKDQKVLYYDCNAKLAEIYENGCGKWYYINGDLALDYYCAPALRSPTNSMELKLGQRCVVYSTEDEAMKKKIPGNVLACFDFHGNGVVYDKNGSIRLKFNQSEGSVVDKKIGPPGRWKWHTLNDPPALYPVFLNTFLKEESYHKNIENHENILGQSDEMNDIELDKLQREKAAKILQKYKSFDIRIKVVKVNKYFTLRIINQAKMYLLFRYKSKCLKLNLGMLLKNEDIIGSYLVEASEVATPYD